LLWAWLLKRRLGREIIEFFRICEGSKVGNRQSDANSARNG